MPGKAATLLGIRCLSCHNPEKKAGGLDLTTRQAALHALMPGRGAESRVVKMASEGKMPPDAKLPDAEIALLKRWIVAGAVYGHEPLVAIKPPVKPLWSFQPLKQQTPPHSRFDTLARNPIDRFIFAKLEQNGLASRLSLCSEKEIRFEGHRIWH